MKQYHYIKLLFIIFTLLPNMTLALHHLENHASIEFFVSNNVKEIDIPTAIHRLHGKEQVMLQEGVIRVMQKERMEQSRLEDVLGVYTMLNKQHVTFDNSEKITTSPYQTLSLNKIFKIAKKLTNTFHQESVAIFIPDPHANIGDTTLTLTHHYTLDEIIKIIHEKLPPPYSNAFSLHLNHETIDQIEWLGRKIKSIDIKQSFPQETITIHNGKAYLIYQNGQKERI